MSEQHVSELPDPIFASVVAVHNPTQVLRTRTNDNGTFIDAHIGPVYIGMSVDNWRTVISALNALTVEPRPTFRLIMNDQDRTAKFESVTE